MLRCRRTQYEFIGETRIETARRKLKNSHSHQSLKILKANAERFDWRRLS